MSVALMRFASEDGACIFCHPVSTERKYVSLWSRAIADEHVQLFREYYGFTVEQLDEALDELRRIRNWCGRNLDHESVDYHYMIRRIDTLLEVIPQEAPNSDARFELI